MERRLIVELMQGARVRGREQYARAQDDAVEVLCLGSAQPPHMGEDQHGVQWLDPAPYAARAGLKLRELYPTFLHQLSVSSGLLDILSSDGAISLYWFMPISEMSALRNPLIEKLYALMVLDLVISDRRYASLTLVTDDQLLELPVREIAKRRAVMFRDVDVVAALPAYKNRWGLITAWWLAMIRDVALWTLIRSLLPGRPTSPAASDSCALALTIFPTLWQQSRNGLETRQFGKWPAELMQAGHEPLYLAIPGGGVRRILRSLKVWRTNPAADELTFIHALVSLRELLSYYARGGWGRPAQAWLDELGSIPITFDDLPVTDLIRREFLQEIWSPSIPLCCMIAAAAARLMHDRCAVIGYYAFEFQPIEKAFNLGVKAYSPRTPLVGLQTSFIGSSHLGYRFLPQQVSSSNARRVQQAPTPDFVCTFGTVPQQILENALGLEHVFLSGPVRYPYLRPASAQARADAQVAIKTRLNLPDDIVLILIGLPSLPEQAKSILESCLRLGVALPNIFFLIRFHYWADLSDFLAGQAARLKFQNYIVASGELNDLLLAARAIVTGPSSIAIEAMVSGCMPIVQFASGRADETLSAISDVADGAFLFDDEAQLRDAVQSSIEATPSYRTRVDNWPALIDRLCFGPGETASTRLYHWLEQRGAFNMYKTEMVHD